MPRCYSDKCRRENLPVAAVFPPIAKIAPAHVRPDGEPCTELPGTYAEDVHEMILGEDKLWDLDGQTAVVDPPEREVPLKSAINPPEREVLLIPREAPPPPTPKKTDRRSEKRRRAKGASEQRPSVEEAVDVDDWDP